MKLYDSLHSPSIVGLGLGTGGSPVAVSSTVIGGGGSLLVRCKLDILRAYEACRSLFAYANESHGASATDAANIGVEAS